MTPAKTPMLPILLRLLLPLLLPIPAAATPAPLGATALCASAIAAAERELALPPRLLAAIGRVESGRRDPVTGAFGPYPWTVNAEGRGSFYPTKAAAIAAVRQMQAEGIRSIDVGCMQVNLKHHPNAFANLEDAFDPVTNARYAGRFLRELQASRGDWQRAAAAYHSSTPEFAGPYQAKVLAAWAEEQRAPAPPPTPTYAAAARPPFWGGGSVGAMMLSNNAERAQVQAAPNPGGGRGLDAYRSAPIVAVGRLPMVYNGPYRRL